MAVLWPLTYMNEAGRSAGPARGALRVPLDHVIAVHDEIDIPFGDVRVRLGGGLAGHNGLKSLKRELGGPDFMRVRVGVGRPASSDPEIVAAYVLSRFREDPGDVRGLIDRAADEVQRIVLGGGPGPRAVEPREAAPGSPKPTKPSSRRSASGERADPRGPA